LSGERAPLDSLEAKTVGRASSRLKGMVIAGMAIGC
jgi:hypothetical protein